VPRPVARCLGHPRRPRSRPRHGPRPHGRLRPPQRLLLRLRRRRAI